MAIPKSLKQISSDKAIKTIQKHLKAKTGEWEYDEPGVGDFIYRTPSGRWYLIRKTILNEYETGQLCL